MHQSNSFDLQTTHRKTPRRQGHDIDERCLERLAGMRPAHAAAAVEKLSLKNGGRIVNKSAYLMKARARVPVHVATACARGVRARSGRRRRRRRASLRAGDRCRR